MQRWPSSPLPCLIRTRCSTRSSSGRSSSVQVEEVRSEYAVRGKSSAFDLFERYDLAPADGVSYASLAREHQLTPAQVTNTLAQVRRRFRERALDSLRGLCGSDDEFRRDAKIFGVDVA